MIIDFNRYNGGGGSGSGSTDLRNYWNSAVTEQHIESAATEVYSSAVSYTDAALSGFTPAGNSNILAAITTDEEYGAISGSVKSGDLIQVWDVDINDDEENETGLFRAFVEEQEDQGVITRTIEWERKDNENSIIWAVADYPWMDANDVWPIDIGGNSFLIASDGLAEDEAYNGIGFDADGNPVTTHIVPEYDDRTGEITGITREDTPIGGSLPVGYEATDYALNDNYQIVTVDGKVFGEDLYDIPTFHSFENGYNDPDRGYVSGAWTKVFGYYDEDENFVPVFLPAGTYAILDTDDFDTEHYGKVINLFYGKVGDEDVIYNNTFYAEDLDSISLVSPLFTITEPTCPTTEDNYYELYLDYTDKPSAQSQLDTLDEVVSAALVDLNEKKVESEDIKHIVKLTQAEYDQLATKDPYTFYIIINNSN